MISLKTLILTPKPFPVGSVKISATGMTGNPGRLVSTDTCIVYENVTTNGTINGQILKNVNITPTGLNFTKTNHAVLVTES